jgi:hypothetical protein
MQNQFQQAFDALQMAWDQYFKAPHASEGQFRRWLCRYSLATILAAFEHVSDVKWYSSTALTREINATLASVVE